MTARQDGMVIYPYARAADQDGATPAHHPVVVVGAGPVGLALALDLGLRGVPVVVLDEGEGPGAGSRAICFARRTLEICDRLGAAAPMMAKGVQWSRGKVFRHDRLIYEFDLSPEEGHRFPAFINLQQPWFERFLFDAIVVARARGAAIDIRGGNRVTALHPAADHAIVEVRTPDGPCSIRAGWVVACDGARSPIRGMLGLGFRGQVFQDNFLIADVRMAAGFPTERWFWFQPHFRSGDSALLHKQPDNLWRIDFQLGRDIDRMAELDPARVRARVDAMLGPGVDYDLDWTSIYTFQCRRMDRFRHGRVIFAGDSAHQVSPFGARGANSGVQDADNLGWKLAMVAAGTAPEALLDSYCAEREQAADENILASTRATEFISPKSAVSAMFRAAVLDLAEQVPFARAWVNSGRLSVPCIHDGSPLNGPDAAGLPDATRPGAPCPDAPLGGDWLLRRVGPDFTLLAIGCEVPEAGVRVVHLDPAGQDVVRARYLGDAAQAVYLLRPDGHVAARWHGFDAGAVQAALDRATGKDMPCP
jgi:3-(3-hydroxy-phenyl)propionate hydroxylase